MNVKKKKMMLQKERKSNELIIQILKSEYINGKVDANICFETFLTAF
jgi:hypothetical protein